jgi:hypothetical protein
MINVVRKAVTRYRQDCTNIQSILRHGHPHDHSQGGALPTLTASPASLEDTDYQGIWAGVSNAANMNSKVWGKIFYQIARGFDNEKYRLLHTLD